MKVYLSPRPITSLSDRKGLTYVPAALLAPAPGYLRSPIFAVVTGTSRHRGTANGNTAREGSQNLPEGMRSRRKRTSGSRSRGWKSSRWTWLPSDLRAFFLAIIDAMRCNIAHGHDGLGERESKSAFVALLHSFLDLTTPPLIPVFSPS